jgi:hypothetical protein
MNVFSVGFVIVGVLLTGASTLLVRRQKLSFRYFCGLFGFGSVAFVVAGVSAVRVDRRHLSAVSALTGLLVAALTGILVQASIWASARQRRLREVTEQAAIDAVRDEFVAKPRPQPAGS